jgi:FkbM family methyltransferase
LKPLVPLLPSLLVDRLPVVGTVTVAVPGGPVLRLDSDGRDRLAAGLFWRGPASFEPETVRVFWRLLPGCEIVFDVGAHTGIYSLLAGLESPERRVFAFEPVPETAERLRRNLTGNGLTNVHPVESAVSDRDGTLDLHIPPGVSLPLGASARPDFRRPGRRIQVPSITLDTFVQQQAIPRVDLIKIDTEATEPQVLAGARRLLARDQPIVICEVLRDLTETALHAVFAGTPYRFFLITAEGLVSRQTIVGDERYRERNYLFVTPRRLDRVASAVVIVGRAE